MSEPQWYVMPDTIKEARQKAGLTQKGAADLIGYTKRAWQHWEAGTRHMKPAVFDYFVAKCFAQLNVDNSQSS